MRAARSGAGPAPAGTVAEAPVDEVVIDLQGLDALLDALRAGGRRVLGPVVRNGAVVQGEPRTVDDLPRGWHDVQGPGTYRLEQGHDEWLFAWAVGPQSVKAELFPPASTLWRRRLPGDEAPIEEERDTAPPVAVLGARPCDLAALSVLDAALGGAPVADPRYRARRHSAFVVAVECGAPSGSCFCTSTGTGPAASGGFDLALTELLDDRGHRFLVRVGSERGAAVLRDLPRRPASPTDLAARRAVLEGAEGRIGRTLDTDGLAALLERNIEHPRWDDLAARCLSCGNCTTVCPTCFCSSVEDVSLLDGSVERHRRWSSCFDLDHSYLHGGAVRKSPRARYRQWLTHKLSTWWEQFGMSGCVGCGRCITWCPVGIDFTEEAAAIRRADGARQAD